jgi:hypothetical protein
MPSRFQWDCDLPKAAAFKVAGKFFLPSGLCGRASGQQATADLVKRIPDSSAWDSTLITLSTGTLYRLLVLIRGFGLRIEQPAMLDLARNLLPRICAVVSGGGHGDRAHAT